MENQQLNLTAIRMPPLFPILKTHKYPNLEHLLHPNKAKTKLCTNIEAF